MLQKYFILCCFMLLTAVTAGAQNVSSPYSILGIGDIETNDYGRYSASGSAAISRREAGFYNFSNPASLTVMPYKAINLDFSFRGRVSKFKLPGADTLTLPSKDFIIKRATIAFKVTPTVAFAFGLKPYSSANYKYVTTTALNDGNTDLIKSADGSGGIYQSYFSIAKEYKKHFSVGATASWLFGAMQNTTEYYNTVIGLDVIKNENKFYNAAGLQGGLQYYTKAGKKWQHTVGVTASAFTKLKGQNTTDYTENSTTIKTSDPVNIEFKLPVSFGAGYSIANNSGLSLHLQGSYNKWPAQKLYYQNSYTKDAYGLSAGMEYSKRVSTPDYVIEKYYLGWGVKMEQSYLVINNQHINDYGVSFGGGKNLSRLLSASAGIEIGKRGSSYLNQIKENYVQFHVGLTLKDIWYGTKRFGRYN
ncbi:hypothetical protein [Ferruginibacter profundus]